MDSGGKDARWPPCSNLSLSKRHPEKGLLGGRSPTPPRTSSEARTRTSDSRKICSQGQEGGVVVVITRPAPGGGLAEAKLWCPSRARVLSGQEWVVESLSGALPPSSPHPPFWQHPVCRYCRLYPAVLRLQRPGAREASQRALCPLRQAGGRKCPPWSLPITVVFNPQPCPRPLARPYLAILHPLGLSSMAGGQEPRPCSVLSEIPPAEDQDPGGLLLLHLRPA